MIPLSWSNIDEPQPGDLIFYSGRFGTLAADPRYTDGLRIDGMSLHYVLENNNNVYYTKKNQKCTCAL